MLRQLTSTQNNPYEALAQPQPVYVEGYGFVPPSQADVLRNQTPAGLAAPGLGSVAQVPSGELPGFNGWFGSRRSMPDPHVCMSHTRACMVHAAVCMPEQVAECVPMS